MIQVHHVLTFTLCMFWHYLCMFRYYGTLCKFTSSDVTYMHVLTLLYALCKFTSSDIIKWWDIELVWHVPRQFVYNPFHSCASSPFQGYKVKLDVLRHDNAIIMITMSRVQQSQSLPVLLRRLGYTEPEKNKKQKSSKNGTQQSGLKPEIECTL